MVSGVGTLSINPVTGEATVIPPGGPAPLQGGVDTSVVPGGVSALAPPVQSNSVVVAPTVTTTETANPVNNVNASATQIQAPPPNLLANTGGMSPISAPGLSPMAPLPAPFVPRTPLINSIADGSAGIVNTPNPLGSLMSGLGPGPQAQPLTGSASSLGAPPPPPIAQSGGAGPMLPPAYPGMMPGGPPPPPPNPLSVALPDSHPLAPIFRQNGWTPPEAVAPIIGGGSAPSQGTPTAPAQPTYESIATMDPNAPAPAMTAGQLQQMIADQSKKAVDSGAGDKGDGTKPPQLTPAHLNFAQKLGLLMSPRAQAMYAQRQSALRTLNNQVYLKGLDAALDEKRDAAKEAAQLDREKTIEGIKHEYKELEQQHEKAMTAYQMGQMRLDMIKNFAADSPQRMALVAQYPALASDLSTPQDPATVVEQQKKQADLAAQVMDNLSKQITFMGDAQAKIANNDKAVRENQESAATSQGRVAATNAQNQATVSKSPYEAMQAFYKTITDYQAAANAGPDQQLKALSAMQSAAKTAADILGEVPNLDPRMKAQLKGNLDTFINLGQAAPELPKPQRGQPAPQLPPPPLAQFALSAASNAAQAANGMNGMAVPPPGVLQAAYFNPAQAQATQGAPPPPRMVAPPFPGVPAPQQVIPTPAPQRPPLQAQAQQISPAVNSLVNNGVKAGQWLGDRALDAIGYTNTRKDIDALGDFFGRVQRVTEKLPEAMTAARKPFESAAFQDRVNQAVKPGTRPEARGLKPGTELTDPDLVSHFAVHSNGTDADYRALVKAAGWTPTRGYGSKPQPLTPQFVEQTKRENLARMAPLMATAALRQDRPPPPAPLPVPSRMSYSPGLLPPAFRGN